MCSYEYNHVDVEWMSKTEEIAPELLHYGREGQEESSDLEQS